MGSIEPSITTPLPHHISRYAIPPCSTYPTGVCNIPKAAPTRPRRCERRANADADADAEEIQSNDLESPSLAQPRP